MAETQNSDDDGPRKLTPANAGPSMADMRARLIQAVREHKTLFYIEAALMIVAGIAAILLPHIATLAASLFLGWALMIVGILGLFAVVSRRKAPGIIWGALSVLLALAAGIVILAFPAQAIISLTFILAIFFVAEGFSRLAFAWQLRHGGCGWGWVAVSGLLGIVLGLFIVAALPQTSTWVIGLLVGINLLIYGIGLFALVSNIDKAE